MKKKTLAAVLIAVGLMMTGCGGENTSVSSPIQTPAPISMGEKDNTTTSGTNYPPQQRKAREQRKRKSLRNILTAVS